MKNLVNRVEVIEQELQKREINREVTNKNKIRNQRAINEASQIKIDKLPYSYDSLKSFIDPETMDVHYNKHYKGYVDKLNLALKTKNTDDDLEKIVKNIKKFNSHIRNNAGGAYNHSLFWKMLTPKKMTPRNEISKRIQKDFGSLLNFKKKFEAIAKERFGSGWVWLVLDNNGKLKIMSTANQDNPLMNAIEGGGYPLLGLDLWEHAYYLRYRNKRDEYIKNFWNVVNWQYVNDILLTQIKKPLVESVNSIIFEDMEPVLCDYQTSSKYTAFLNNNPDLMNAYKDTVNEIVKSMFSSFMRGETQDTGSGVYGLEGESGKRSIINNFNTNYSVFCYIVGELSKKAVSLDKKPFTFTEMEDQASTVKEFNRFLNAFKYFKNEIFDTNGEMFRNIMAALTKFDREGKEREERVVTKSNQFFGEDNVMNTSGAGKKEDMFGVDIKIQDKGTWNTAQVKPFWKINKNPNDTYSIHSSGRAKKFKTDWLIFENKKNGEIKVFKNEGVSIENKEYIIPVYNLLYSL
jgi:Fe-Mn family superoxide dismutase